MCETAVGAGEDAGVDWSGKPARHAHAVCCHGTPPSVLLHDSDSIGLLPTRGPAHESIGGGMLGYVFVWDLGLCLVLFGLLCVLFLCCLPASLDEREDRHGGPLGIQAAPETMYI